MTHSFKHHENDAHTVRPAQCEHFQPRAPQYDDPQYSASQYGAPQYKDPERSSFAPSARSFNQQRNQSSFRTSGASHAPASAGARSSASVATSDGAPQGFMERFQHMMARRRKQKARALFNKRYGEENVPAGAASGLSSGASPRSASGAATRSPFASASSATSASSAASADTQSRTPKAAIYEGSTRRAHKNTASFEDARKRPMPSRYSKATLLDRVLERLHLSGKKAVVIGVVVCVCAIIIFLYEPTRNYYQGVRMNQAKQIELQALQENLHHLETETSEIRGEEGARTLARNRGYAAKNETLGQVDGLSDDYSDEEVNRKRSLHRNMARRFTPPDTWYSPVLDVLFGVKKMPDSSLPDAEQGKASPENSAQNGSATSANGSAPQNGASSKSSNGAQNGNSEQNSTASKSSNASHNSNAKNTSRGSEQSR